MSKNSAFARVIELTRSFSPFDRSETDGGADDTSAVIATAIAEEAAESGDEPALALQLPPPEPADKAGDVYGPALTQVTLVAAEHNEVDVAEAARQAVTEDAIQAIEADIASLIAGFDSEEQAEGNIEGESERATMELLSELDRLWRADPATGNGTVH